MTEPAIAEYVEKSFPTTMALEHFRKLALRTCKLPHWVELEGRDRSTAPHTLFISVVFCNPEERDRFVIALRYAEDERAALAKAPVEPKSGARRLTAAGAFVPA